MPFDRAAYHCAWRQRPGNAERHRVYNRAWMRAYRERERAREAGASVDARPSETMIREGSELLVRRGGGGIRPDVLPEMSRRQRLDYKKLRSHGVGREEALAVILGEG